MINAPIPGMSLTGEPKKYPWERPPELVEPEAVADYYIDKLSNKDTMRSVLDMLVIGDLNLRELVEGMMRVGVSKGLHTIDVGLIVAPIVHKTIKMVADAVDIEYDEGLVDKKAKETNEKARRRLFTKKILSKVSSDNDVVEEVPAEEEKEVLVEELTQGLIPRRVK
jgi:hypothetical protein